MVSARCGVVRSSGPIEPEAPEPFAPYRVRANPSLSRAERTHHAEQASRQYDQCAERTHAAAKSKRTREVPPFNQLAFRRMRSEPQRQRIRQHAAGQSDPCARTNPGRPESKRTRVPQNPASLEDAWRQRNRREGWLRRGGRQPVNTRITRASTPASVLPVLDLDLGEVLS